MRPFGTVATAILLTSSAIGFLGPAAPALATTKDDVALNGTYRVTSIGNWARINDQFNGEPTTVQTWTMTSSCTSILDCQGTVQSSEGWSAPLYMHDGELWYVKHEVPNWERCEDGTAYSGKQTFSFYPADPTGTNGGFVVGSPVLAGKNKTVGPSGACGQNQWLTIELPLRMDRIS
jgi:hypothetical protein